MKRSTLWVVTGLVFCYIILGASLVLAAERQNKLDLQFFTPLGLTHDVNQIVLKNFIEPVAAETNGRIKFNLRPAGELPYKGTEALDILRDKLVDMSYIIGPYVGGVEPLFDVPNYAYLVKSQNEVPAMLKVIRPVMEKTMAEKWNSVILIENVWPGQHVWSGTKIIKTVGEIKGMKIRSHGLVSTDLSVILGASPVTMTVADVYMAFSRGTVDGMWIAVTSAVPSKLHEVTKSILLMDAQFAYDAFAIRKDIWNTLSKSEQDTLTKAGERTTLALREFMFGHGADKLWEVVKARGIMVTALPDSEKGVLRDKVKPYWDKWAKQGGAESQSMLTELRKALP